METFFGAYCISNWRASEVSETRDKLYSRDRGVQVRAGMVYVYIYICMEVREA